MLNTGYGKKSLPPKFNDTFNTISENNNNNIKNYVLSNNEDPINDNLIQNNDKNLTNNIDSQNFTLSNDFFPSNKKNVIDKPITPKNIINNDPKNNNFNHTSNIININSTVDSMIMVEYNDTNKRFLFYDKNNTFLGSFDINEFIKYIISFKYKNFMENISFEDSKHIIEKYICKTFLNENEIDINIINHLESPFTGHLEMLIIFLKNFEEFKKTYNNFLLNFNQTEILDISNIINNTYNILLNHILKIISILSETLINENNPDMKANLIKYSVAITFKITNNLKNSFKLNNDNLIKIYDQKEKIKTLKNNIDLKIDDIKKVIDEQNNKIDELLNNNLEGGSKESSSNQFVSTSNKVLDSSDIKIYDTSESNDVLSEIVNYLDTSDSKTESESKSESKSEKLSSSVDKQSSINSKSEKLSSSVNKVSSSNKNSCKESFSDQESDFNIKYLSSTENIKNETYDL